MNTFDVYKVTIFVIGFTGLLFFIQLLIADVVGLRRKHQPGFPVDADYDDFFFRASRAFLNSNETASIFLMLAVFAMLSSANATSLNTAALVYFFARLFHMLFYYFSFSILRSVSFTVSLIALLAMFVIGYSAW
ncbi:MAPEG family protein [Enterovibrio coralii]|uniref:MAPEG family protein n=1 Tax=Enterovibrio coralii TaxID=294935 RepID=A0A135I984_9GAMM|nr:MAPEG family protein [Enterovibrio coralii]KXF81944.1 hypothetical protein ATN88_18440 [Enterovibrio coralii]